MAIHEGHRKRIIKRFLTSDTSSFATHELLEMVLFYSLPRQNTNTIAHELLARFGTLKNIATADIKELCLVKGISETSAILLKLMLSLAERCVLEDIPDKLLLNNETIVLNFANRIFTGANQEIIYLLSLDSDFRVLDCSIVSYGSINESRPIIRSIVEKCVLTKATNAILLHNHESNNANPSNEDIEFSIELNKILKVLNVTLIDHFIVTKNESSAILKDIDGKMRFLENSDKIKDFYE